MATDFNAIFNNLIPLLLQAKQQRIANERQDKQLQLQAQQQATAGRQRERQLDITEETADRQLKQREKQYLNQTYDGLTWSEKKVWIESGKHIPYGLNPISELRMINSNIQNEDDARQLKFDTQETQKQLLNLGLRQEEREDAIIKPTFKTSLDRQYFRNLEANQALIDRELSIPGINKKRRTELIGQRESIGSEMEKFFPKGTFPDDILNLFGDKKIDLDLKPQLQSGDIARVKSLPLAGKTQKVQFDMVRASLNNPDLTDGEIRELIRAQGLSQISDFFKGLQDIGTTTGKFTPEISGLQQSGIQKLIQ